MGKCIEGTGRWSNAADVSPHELDEFLEHIELCPFHTEVFREAEEELRSVFRLAGGLDSHGKTLTGEQLRASIAKHDTRRAAWKKFAREMKSPVEGIYLTNRDEKIALSGKFFDFRKYEADHLLDPRAGLQVWGVIGEKDSPDALLGFYPLEGFQHAGNEELLHLENGYTVGLRIKHLAGQNFKVEFRCVEDEVLEQERLGYVEQEDLPGELVSEPTGSVFFQRFAKKAKQVISNLARPVRLDLRPAIAAATALCLIVSVTIGSVLLQLRYGEIESQIPPVKVDPEKQPMRTAFGSSEEGVASQADKPSGVSKPSSLRASRAKRDSPLARVNVP